MENPFEISLKALFYLNQGSDGSNFDFVRGFRILVHVCKTPFMEYDFFINAL